MTEHPSRMVTALRGVIVIGAAVLAVLVLGAGTGQAEGSGEGRLQCGHWAVLRCAEVLGIPLSADEVVSLLPCDARGHSLAALQEALGRLGLRGEGRSETPDVLARGAFPVIAHLMPDHYVVVTHVDDSHTVVFDGEGRRQALTNGEFGRRWTGRLLRVHRDGTGLGVGATGPLQMPGARISFQTLYIERGEIPADGKPVDFVFQFRNVGTTDLVIDGVRHDCKCMSARYSQCPIPAGSEGEICVTYSTVSAGGAFSHSTYVSSNDPRAPVVRLTAAGNLGVRVRVEPRYVDFNDIPQGGTATRLLRLTSSGDLPLDVVGVVPSVPSIRADWDVFRIGPVGAPSAPAAGRDQPIARVAFLYEHSGTAGSARSGMDHVAYVKLSLVPEPGACGRVEGQVIVCTNVAGYERVSIPVTGTVVPEVLALPDVLFLGELRSRERLDFTKAFLLRSATGTPFSVESAEAGGLGLEVQCAHSESSTMYVRVHGTLRDPVAAVGTSLSFRVRLHDEAKAGLVEIPIRGFVPVGLRESTAPQGAPRRQGGAP